MTDYKQATDILRDLLWYKPETCPVSGSMS